MIVGYNNMLGGIFLVLTVSIDCFNGQDFPSTIKRCKHEDKKCIAATINELVKVSGSGIPEIGVKPVNPYSLPKINVDRGEGSPVVLKILLKNNSIINFDCFVADTVIGFDRNPKESAFQIKGHCDSISMVGPYKITGRFLLLPVTGQGQSNITFVNNHFTMTWLTDVETRNGEDFLKIKNVDYRSTTKRFLMNLDNLFNNKVLSDNMNAIFNENDQLIFKEVQPSIESVFGNVLRDLIQPVFDKYPYKNLFLD